MSDHVLRNEKHEIHVQGQGPTCTLVIITDVGINPIVDKLSDLHKISTACRIAELPDAVLSIQSRFPMPLFQCGPTVISPLQ